MSVQSSISHGSVVAVTKPRFDVIVFDGKDFGLWKMRMEGLFMAHDILDVVEKGVGEALQDDHREELQRKSQLAYGILIQALKDEQLRLVQGVVRGDAHGIWKILLETYERKSMATRVQLLEQLFGTQLIQKGNERESMASYVARLTELERRLRAQGEQVSESIMVYLLLKGLPNSYTSIVQLMKMKETLGFNEAVESLKNEEERQNVKKVSGVGGAELSLLQAANAVMSTLPTRQLEKGCFSCGAHDHIKYNCPMNQNKKHCEKCHRVGHTAKECKMATHHADVAIIEDFGLQYAY